MAVLALAGFVAFGAVSTHAHPIVDIGDAAQVVAPTAAETHRPECRACALAHTPMSLDVVCVGLALPIPSDALHRPVDVISHDGIVDSVQSRGPPPVL